MRARGFEIVAGYEDCGIRLPRRRTAASAGYDIEAAAEARLAPGESAFVPTGLKAFMQPDEVLFLHIRSSLAVRHGIALMNTVGVIDADYYGNPGNEGHIMLALMNWGKEMFLVEKGMRIAQGIFSKYLAVDGDCAGNGIARIGGFGSTGQD